MNPEKKLPLTAFLAAVGSIGIILVILLDPPDLGRPWDFLIGFGLGVAAGLGATLSIYSLFEKRP